MFLPELLADQVRVQHHSGGACPRVGVVAHQRHLSACARLRRLSILAKIYLFIFKDQELCHWHRGGREGGGPGRVLVWAWFSNGLI